MNEKLMLAGWERTAELPCWARALLAGYRRLVWTGFRPARERQEAMRRGEVQPLFSGLRRGLREHLLSA